MTEKFDAEKQRFGMAYADQDGDILYIERESGGDYRLNYVRALGALTFEAQELTDLTRVPEHDLVPMADVKPLLDALNASRQCIADVVDYYGRRVSMMSLDEAVKSLKNDAGKLVKNALTDFAQKHGE